MKIILATLPLLETAANKENQQNFTDINYTSSYWWKRDQKQAQIKNWQLKIQALTVRNGWLLFWRTLFSVNVWATSSCSRKIIGISKNQAQCISKYVYYIRIMQMYFKDTEPLDSNQCLPAIYRPWRNWKKLTFATMTDFLSIFMAKSSLVAFSRHRITFPKVPLPRTLRNSKSSIVWISYHKTPQNIEQSVINQVE